jgi:hypothetical protein
MPGFELGIAKGRGKDVAQAQTPAQAGAAR